MQEIKKGQVWEGAQDKRVEIVQVEKATVTVRDLNPKLGMSLRKVPVAAFTGDRYGYSLVSDPVLPP